MRILQVSSARSFGGGERHLADLSRGLVVRGHELFFALSGGSPLLGKLDFVPQENLFTLAPRGALDIGGALRLARIAREKKVDVIHAHVARDYLPAAFAARRARAARFVVTRHVLFPLSRIHRRSLSNVSRVIAVSGAVERALREQDIFDQKKIRVVANGVDVARFAGARCEFEQARREFERARREPGRDANGKTFRVGIVGELSEVKGQEVFVRAASLVYEKFGASVEFIIAGEDDANAGEYRARVERLITELGLKSCVRLKGRCDDVARLLASLDVFVSASRTESFGMAMAEALVCGVPVVATATEGAREVVEDESTGLIVPIGDASAIAAAVVSLLEDEARRLAFASRASSSARERFALERMIEETERVYAEAVGC